MRRQLGVGLLTKIARNGPSINVISPKSVSPSSFLTPNSIPFHRRSLSEYSTLSRSHSWKICCPNGLRGAIQNGALPSSLLARRVFSNALLQGRAKFPVTFCNRRSMASFSLDNRRYFSLYLHLCVWTIYVDFILPVPALLAGAYFIGSDMWKVWKGDTRISGAAHLGGAAVGVLAWLSKRKRRFGRF